jgi:competence protein ComFC
MSFFRNLISVLLEFLFPKSPNVIHLESLSSGELMNTLKPSPSNNKNLITLFDYKDPLVRELIWELKYEGNKIVADKFGEILFDVLSDELSERSLFEKWKSPLLIPIPISDSRRFERGWNQSELLAKAIKKCDKQNQFKYLGGQLVRFRNTESQTKTASRSERLHNVENSMRVLRPELFKDKCVILIDDVSTTGATFAEAKRVLTEIGVKKIICISVAH